MCFDALSYHYNIFWTNLLIQCPVPVSVCFVRALQKKVKNKGARKIPKKILNKYSSQKTPKARRGPRGGHPLARGPPGAARGEAAPPGRLVRWGLPLSPPSPIYFPRYRNPRGEPRYAISSTVPPPKRFRSRDRREKLSRHPAGGRIDLRRPLHHHDRLRGVP